MGYVSGAVGSIPEIGWFVDGEGLMSLSMHTLDRPGPKPTVWFRLGQTGNPGEHKTLQRRYDRHRQTQLRISN
ncbi:hypothetical protein [Mycobacterium sp. 1245852.3]|uniref:hypothetical protein n=1 Tax=Mycobacterium sp. 1245852.3 TaxID=1856860 RepID=UPI0012EA0D4F|nr:hypothetical protein [Mycobacterium sp. 1245852.3]